MTAAHVTVSTSAYEFAHGKRPRGTGHWAFYFRNGTSEVGEMFWASGSYSAAKAAAVREAVARGASTVVVAS
jgi:hypothetical protein